MFGEGIVVPGMMRSATVRPGLRPEGLRGDESEPSSDGIRQKRNASRHRDDLGADGQELGHINRDFVGTEGSKGNGEGANNNGFRNRLEAKMEIRMHRPRWMKVFKRDGYRRMTPIRAEESATEGRLRGRGGKSLLLVVVCQRPS